MTKLILVRHGQSQWNLENRFTGDVDVDLTDKGVTEARRAGQLLKDYHFHKAFTSVLKRAIRTLDIILSENRYPDVAVVRDAALNERRYGDLQGLNKTETGQRYGAEQVAIWRRSFDVAPPGGESLKDTAARVIPFYKLNIEPGLINGETLLISAHGNSLRALMMFLENISPADIERTDIATGIPREYAYDQEMNLIAARDIG